jgi:hypothetical protein
VIEGHCAHDRVLVLFERPTRNIVAQEIIALGHNFGTLHVSQTDKEIEKEVDAEHDPVGERNPTDRKASAAALQKTAAAKRTARKRA